MNTPRVEHAAEPKVFLVTEPNQLLAIAGLSLQQ